MKKKLIAGFLLIALTFVISGLFIFWNINTVIVNQKLQDEQEDMISEYNDILYNLRSAQVQLYRQRAGFTRDIDSLTGFILNATETLTLINKEHFNAGDRELCNSCHSGQKVFKNISDAFKDLNSRLDAYKDNISLIVTSKDNRYIFALESETVEIGTEIINSLYDLRHAALKMNKKLKELVTKSEQRSRHAIIGTLIASFLIAAIFIFITIRSVTGPVNLLLKGIENVSSGDYDSKVNITTADEMGFLANTFNSMTDSLNAANQHKDLLLNELHTLNSDLKIRVEKSIEELRLANEQMLRSETLSLAGAFAAGVAHELATPLASILSYLQVVNRQIAEEDKLKKDINIIESELQRCRDILRGMLDFARAPEKEKMPTNINNLLQELLLLVSYQSEYKKTIIKKELDPEIPSIMSIPGKLKQVFMNVIINALQSMPEGGELNVSTAIEGNPQHIVVTIKDTGSGISEEDMSRIFQPFYTSKKTGTGLGLSISYGIIKAHGGEVEIKSNHEEGTSFFIYLPVV